MFKLLVLFVVVVALPIGILTYKADSKFRGEYLIPEIDHLAGKLGVLECCVIYLIAIAQMRERILMLHGRFGFVLNQPEWGPDRVDTFNSPKVLFNFPMDKLPAHELIGASDFPSIWTQRNRQGMQLHWDGNNTMVEERNKSAAFGTGTTPPSIDLAAIGHVEHWLPDCAPLICTMARYPRCVICWKRRSNGPRRFTAAMTFTIRRKSDLSVSQDEDTQRIGTRHDTTRKGGSNQGHTFGTQLPAKDKDALVRVSEDTLSVSWLSAAAANAVHA